MGSLIWGSLILAFACAIIISLDEVRHPQKMWIMNVVWPVTALYLSVFTLWAYFAIESIVSSEDFTASLTKAQELAQPQDFDFLHRIGEGYATVRRYAPELPSTLALRAAPAAKPVLDAIELLRKINADNAHKLPDSAPLAFICER